MAKCGSLDVFEDTGLVGLKGQLPARLYVMHCDIGKDTYYSHSAFLYMPDTG